MAKPAKHYYLAFTLMGKDNIGLINSLAELIINTGCTINQCQANVLGEESVLAVLLSGTWNAIAKIESGLSSLEKEHGLSYLCKRTELPKVEKAFIPYTVQLVALENPEIIYDVSNFFTKLGISIQHLEAGRFQITQTNAVMFNLNMTVNFPADTHIPDLRERFMMYCDDLNLDAVLEPVKFS